MALTKSFRDGEVINSKIQLKEPDVTWEDPILLAKNGCELISGGADIPWNDPDIDLDLINKLVKELANAKNNPILEPEVTFKRFVDLSLIFTFNLTLFNVYFQEQRR